MSESNPGLLWLHVGQSFMLLSVVGEHNWSCCNAANHGLVETWPMLYLLPMDTIGIAATSRELDRQQGFCQLQIS